MNIIRRNNTALTPWVRDINSLFDHFEREIESAFRGFDTGLVVPIFEGKYSYPKVNIIQIPGNNEYVIEAAVPGLEKDDINLEIKEQDGKKVLEISGKKESESESSEGFIRREIKYSSFLRSFFLPEDVVEEKIEAKCSKGILEIKIPISQKVIPKQDKKVIAIK